MTEVRGQMIADLARSYIGTPWRHQGRSRTGLDCVGLLYRVWCDLGHDPSVDGTGYGHILDGRRLRETVERLLRRVPGPCPGVVVLMAQKGMHPLHVGIISILTAEGDMGAIIHANATARGVVEQAFVPALGLRPVAYYEFPEAEMEKIEKRSEERERRALLTSRSSLLSTRFSAAPEVR